MCIKDEFWFHEDKEALKYWLHWFGTQHYFVQYLNTGSIPVELILVSYSYV